VDVDVGVGSGEVGDLGVGLGVSVGVGSGEVEDVDVDSIADARAFLLAEKTLLSRAPELAGILLRSEGTFGNSIEVSVAVTVGVAVKAGGAVGTGVDSGNIGVTTSKRAIVAAMGKVRSTGQVIGSLSQPASSHGSRTRYTPNVASPASELLSTYTYNVARKTSVPGGKASSGKCR